MPRLLADIRSSKHMVKAPAGPWPYVWVLSTWPVCAEKKELVGTPKLKSYLLKSIFQIRVYARAKVKGVRPLIFFYHSTLVTETRARRTTVFLFFTTAETWSKFILTIFNFVCYMQFVSHCLSLFTCHNYHHLSLGIYNMSSGACIYFDLTPQQMHWFREYISLHRKYVYCILRGSLYT